MLALFYLTALAYAAGGKPGLKDKIVLWFIFSFVHHIRTQFPWRRLMDCIFVLTADAFAFSKAVIKPDVGVIYAEGCSDIWSRTPHVVE